MTTAPPEPAPAPEPAVAAAPKRPRFAPVAALRAIGRPPRIMGLDIARGLAVIGMAAAHMADPPVLNWADPATWLGVVHGRAAILFALLAGISTALITGRTVRPEPADLPRLRLRLLGRGAAIFAVGLGLELLNTNIAIILCVYGLLFIAAIPFLRWRPRTLLAGAIVLAIAGPFALAALRAVTLGPYGPGVSIALFGVYPIPVWLAFMLAGLAIGRMRFTGAKAAAWLLLIGICLAGFGYAAGAYASDQLGASYQEGSGMTAPKSSEMKAPPEDDGSYFTVPGDQLAQQLGVTGLDAPGVTCDGQLNQWLNCYLPDDSVAGDAPVEDDTYGTRLRSTDPGRQILDSGLAVSEHSGGVFEILGSGGFVLAVLGLCLLAARSLRWLLLPVACLGMMPLTTYSAHVVVYWLAAGGPLGTFEPSYALWWWTIAGLAVGATAWAALLGKGPLERFAAWTARRAERGV